MAHTNLAKSKNALEHVLAQRILLVALGQTIVFCEAKMLCLKANLLRAKALLPKVNLLVAKALLQKSSFARLVCARPKADVHTSLMTGFWNVRYVIHWLT